MIRFNKTASLAAILATTVSGAALAQTATYNPDGRDAGAAAGDPTPSVSVEGSTAGAVTAGTEYNPDGRDAGALAGDPTNGAVDGSASTMATADTEGAYNPDGRDAGAAAGDPSKMTYKNVIASVESGANVNSDVSTIKADSSVKMMTLSQIEGTDDETALDTAMANAEGDMTSYRGMIASNADFNAMLEAQGYTSDDVIGVYQSADGSYSVLVDDRS
ncbi:hypothetical protein [Pseudooceanicola onchidii]|uniref:hypothetical protein n=1 Tax=Pseudooceanicola onchidii TaxID=2562279 RepID=UPI0010AA8462|nr:hypothetical protein [Pseudooceanicola onchidii]